ncbi:aspartate aminotransferase family protein [Candidatus Gottesmanbacteria bacterium]|nr:aspartate aminotransferase family protein [Candidatus Gottesmanbacteria bacterium]
MNDNHKYLLPTYPDRGINIIRGEGVYLYDVNGKKYIDFGSNYGVSILGYGNKVILSALKSQIEKLINLHGSLGNPVRDQAARKLVNMCGKYYSQVYFCNSGTEAIEAALKFTKLTKRGNHIIAMQHSYHGKTLGALSVTAGEKYREPFTPLIWDVSFADFGTIENLKNSIKKDTIAIIIEPVQGEGGINPSPKGFLKAVRKLCDQNNLLLIIDEIQAGLGRTGSFLVSQNDGISADILCLGKGLAGGIPIGATVVSKNVAAHVPVHIHTSTFGGNPLAMSGILATLEFLSDKKIYRHIQETGDYFLKELKKIRHPKIIDARGVGLMIALELRENATWLLKSLQDKNIIAIPAGSNVVRFLPPYLITEKEIDVLIYALKEIFVK